SDPAGPAPVRAHYRRPDRATAAAAARPRPAGADSRRAGAPAARAGRACQVPVLRGHRGWRDVLPGRRGGTFLRVIFSSQLVVTDNQRRKATEEMRSAMSDTYVQDAVREKYGEIARSAGKKDYCGPAACGCGDPITSNLYSGDETAGLPDAAVAVSLGCGNPTALIDLQPGQTVLDLGSGG